MERRLSAADQLVIVLEQQLDRVRTTRRLLLSEAFSGRLIPQDSKDESASVLLERFRAIREAEAQETRSKLMPKSKSKTVRRPLLDVLREHKKAMTPEKLFRDAGFEASQVDLFYRELASLRDKLREQKPKASKAKLWPSRKDVLLQLREEAEK